MKRKSEKKTDFLQQNKTMNFSARAGLLRALSLLLLSFAAFFVPFQKGLLSSLPLFTLISLTALFLHPFGILEAGVSYLSLVFFSLAEGNSPLHALVLSAVFLLLIYLLSVSVSLFKRKKGVFTAIGVALILLSVLSQLIYAGAPWKILSEKARAEEYLAKTYPNQIFSSVQVYFNPKERSYKVLCSYEYEENVLSSVLVLGERIEDGFLVDFAERAGSDLRAELILLLRDGGAENFEVASAAIPPLFAESAPIYGVYGAEPSEEVIAMMEYTVVLQGSYHQKRVFAASLEKILTVLREEKFSYSSITFIASNAERELFSCTVNPETAPEEIFSLCEAL